MSLHAKPDAFRKALNEHRELRNLNQTLSAFLQEDRPEAGDPRAGEWCAALHRHLMSLHEKLVRHFREEEEEGVLRELELKNPRAARQVAELRDQHTEILGGIRLMVADSMAYAEAGPVDDPRLRQRVQGLLERLSEHEAAETDLIQELVLTDISAGD